MVKTSKPVNIVNIVNRVNPVIRALANYELRIPIYDTRITIYDPKVPLSVAIKPEQPPEEHADPRWLLPVIMVLAFAWFWFFRSNGFTGGDSEQWEREIHGGLWLRKRQMFSFASFQLAYQLAEPLLGWTAHRAINLVSCLAGGVAVGCFWLLVRESSVRWWRFAALATAGFTALFYGHIETYAQPVAALLLHFVAIKRVLEGKWAPVAVPATWSLLVWFHLVGFFVLPAAVVVAAYLCWRSPRRSMTGLALALGFAPGLLLLLLVQVLDFGEGEMVGPLLTDYWAELLREPWRYFVQPQNEAKLWFFLWNGGIITLAGLAALPRWLRTREPFPLALGAYLLCFLGFFAIWDPHRAHDDWDLFNFPFVPAALLGVLGLMELRGRALWLGLILGTQLFWLVQRPLHWAELHRRRPAIVVVEGPQTPFRFVLIDDRRLAKHVNPYVSEGVHYLRYVDMTTGFEQQRFFYAEGGEIFNYRATRQGLEFLGFGLIPTRPDEEALPTEATP